MAAVKFSTQRPRVASRCKPATFERFRAGRAGTEIDQLLDMLEASARKIPSRFPSFSTGFFARACTKKSSSPRSSKKYA